MAGKRRKHGSQPEMNRFVESAHSMAQDEEIVTVKLTRKELYELMNLVSAGFQEGSEGNEVASSASDKLSAAWIKVRKK